MTLKQFRRLLDAYGADVQRWPAAERRAARALLARDEAARAAQRGAAELDRWLDALDPAGIKTHDPVGIDQRMPGEADAAARIAAKLTALPPQAVDWRRAFFDFWSDLRAVPRVPAIVAMLLLGFVVGLASLDMARGLPGVRVDLSALLFETAPSDWLQL